MEKTANINKTNKLIIKQKRKTYLGFLMVFLASFCTALFLPVNDIFKGIASVPAIGALIGTVYQILKDQAAFDRQLDLQRKQQLYNLAVTSHMANVAFDKHVEFCEKYMREVHETVFPLFQKGPTQEALNHAANLYSLRGEYAAWLTQNISSALLPFEQALRKLGSKAYLVEALRGSGDDERKEAIREMSDLLYGLDLEGKSVNADENIAIESIKSKVRKILGIEELTQIREMVIQEVTKLEL